MARTVGRHHAAGADRQRPAGHRRLRTPGTCAVSRPAPLVVRTSSDAVCRRTVLIVAMVLVAGRASGQETRPSLLAIDTEAAVDVAVDENGNDATNLFFDSVVSAR